MSKREWAGGVAGGLAEKAAMEEWMDAHPFGIGSSFYGGLCFMILQLDDFSFEVRQALASVECVMYDSHGHT